MMAWWADLGYPDVTSPAVQKKIVAGVPEEVGERYATRQPAPGMQ